MGKKDEAICKKGKIKTRQVSLKSPSLKSLAMNALLRVWSLGFGVASLV